MDSMPIILLLWMVSFQDLDIKELKKIDCEYKIFLDDEEFEWASMCRHCEQFENDCCCCEPKD